jgi:hypothetical protein
LKHKGFFNVLSAKTAKKALAGALITSMLAMPGLVSAADLPLRDIAKSPYKNEILKLNNVGVIAGYQDGTFQSERHVSRAEFARIAVRALGYSEAQVKLFVGPTKFKDVPKNHWANGYINLAVSRGILSGDVKGTFRPNDKITVAETLSVFVRGLKINVEKGEGAWYLPFLLEANKLGFYKEGAEGPDTPATRGLIAFFADKFMETPVYENGAYYDKDGNAKGTIKKLNVVTGVVKSFDEKAKKIQLEGEKEASTLADNAKIYGNVVAGTSVEYIVNEGKVSFVNVLTDDANVVKGIVKTNLDFTTAVGDENKFKALVDGQEVVLEVTDEVKKAWTQNNIGSKFTAVKDANGKIVTVTFEANEVSGLVEKTIAVSGTNAKQEIVVDGKSYKLAQDVKFTAKAHPAADAVSGNFANIAGGDLVKLTLNVDGEVSAVEYTKLSLTAPITVDTAKNTITVGGKAYSVLADTKLYVSGEAVSELSKLSSEKAATLTFNKEGNLVKVEQGNVTVSDKYITGMTAYKEGTLPTITVDGVTYTIDANADVTLNGKKVAVSSLTTDGALNDYQITSMKHSIGSTVVTELVAEAKTVKGFITAKTDTSVTVNGTVYPLADGVKVDADAATNDKEYTLTLNQDGKVKAIVGEDKTVQGIVEFVNVVTVNGKAETVKVTVNGTEYDAKDAAVVANVDQFEYATLTLTRDGKVKASSVVGNKAAENVSYKGIETSINGDKYVYHTNTDASNKLPLAKDFAVKYFDGSNMSVNDIKSTDKVVLWGNGKEVYLIVVNKR